MHTVGHTLGAPWPQPACFDLSSLLVLTPARSDHRNLNLKLSLQRQHIARAGQGVSLHARAGCPDELAVAIAQGLTDHLIGFRCSSGCVQHLDTCNF